MTSRRSSIVVAKSGLDKAAQLQPQHQTQDRAQAQAQANETVIVKSNNIQEHHEEPLIHTDQVNTSSQTLFVFGQNPRRAIIKNAQQPAGAAAAAAKPAEPAKPDQDQEVEESRGSPALISRKAEARMSAEDSVVRVRLLVLDLEVAKSSATLSWALAVQRQPIVGIVNQQTSKGGRPKQRRRSVDLAEAEPFHGARLKRDTIRVRPTLAKSGSHSFDAEEEDERQPDEEATASESERRDLSSASTQRVTVAAAAATTTAGKQTNGTNTTATVDAELPISRRLQMSRVQSLPAPTNTRRPPVRSSTTTSTTTAAPVPHDLVNSTTTADLTLSTSTTTQRPVKSLQPATRRRVQHQQQATRTRDAPHQFASSSTEPPMVRTPTVALNRIPNINSTTGHRSAKSLAIKPSATAGEKQPVANGSTETLAVATEVRSSTIKESDDRQQASPSNSTTLKPSTISATSSSPSPLSRTTTEKQSPEAAVAKTEQQLTSTTTNKPPTPLAISTTTTTAAAAVSPEVTTNSEEKRMPAGQASNSKETSRWLVRLRRFGSNELDLIKIIINNLNSTLLNNSTPKSLDEDTLFVRQITFKNLSPSSGYEICIESLSPNQEIEDKYQILDSNHFLKCNDNQEEEEEEVAIPLQVPTNTTTTRSLCKEFFTLVESSNEPRINFGQQHWSANKTLALESNSTLANPRRPKSLQTGTTIHQTMTMSPPQMLNGSHHMQLLEINDIFSPNSPREQHFELLSSRANYSNPHEFRWLVHDLQATGSTSTVNTNKAAHNLRDSQEFNLTLSAMPILGCVFGLIFIMTLANILLNSISCWPQRRRRNSQSPINYISSSSSTSRRRHQHRRLSQHHQSAALSDSSPHQQLGSSFYSDNSDISNGSQARFMVVGGKDKGEPAFAGSTVSYFEMPTDPLRVEAAPPNGSPPLSGVRRSNAQNSSTNYLLAAQANRFPLGPSFEGDGKHNADMVGLARKNYDNFINNIYNPSDKCEDGQQVGKPSASSISSHHSYNHNHHHHDYRHDTNAPHLQRPSSHSDALQSPTGKELQLQQTNSLSVRPVSSSVASAGIRHEQAASSRNKHRLRFDKINPIYHMEGLYGTRPTALSSFGQVNVALDMGPESPGGQSASSSSQAAGQCQLCELEQRQGDCSESCTRFDEATCHGVEQVQEFACCLDRQQQRFHKQQQQLERVMSKNGSLVPQPFINPTISTSSDENDSLSNTNEVEELARNNSLNSNTQTAKQQVDSYLFGDNESIGQQRQAPSREPEVGRRKTLVSVGSMQRTTNETMQKGDFDQRRKELASRLQLKGMSQPIADPTASNNPQ